jgi:hypothetical protein
MIGSSFATKILTSKEKWRATDALPFVSIGYPERIGLRVDLMKGCDDFPTVSVCGLPVHVFLGGHLKTGQRGTPQNRPTELGKTRTFITCAAHGGNDKSFSTFTKPCILDSTWDGGYGSAGMRPERQPGWPECAGGAGKLKRRHRGNKHSGDKAINPGSARAEPSHRFDARRPHWNTHQVAGAVLVRQLLGPHFSTWP